MAPISQVAISGAVPPNYHIRLAMFYFGVGIVVILLRGMMTEYVTRLMASRQKIEL